MTTSTTTRGPTQPKPHPGDTVDVRRAPDLDTGRARVDVVLTERDLLDEDGDPNVVIWMATVVSPVPTPHGPDHPVGSSLYLTREEIAW